LVNSRLNQNNCVYRVTKIDDLINVIIPHFNTYPLLTQKYSDFILWSKVANLMSKKEHLTTLGFTTILTYYASINKGLSDNIKVAFPNIVGANRCKTELPVNLNPFWVSGFTAGDGGFHIGIRENTVQIYFNFTITQHSRDYSLMKLFIKFFHCGKLYTRLNVNRADYCVQNFNDIYKYILPHFKKYPLFNIKELNFLDFYKATELFKNKNNNYTESIREIIFNLKSRR